MEHEQLRLFSRRSAPAATGQRHVAEVWQGPDITLNELSPVGAGLFHEAISQAQESSDFGSSVTVHRSTPTLATEVGDSIRQASEKAVIVVRARAEDPDGCRAPDRSLEWSVGA